MRKGLYALEPVRAAPDDHAVGLFGKLRQNLPLLAVDLVPLLLLGVGDRGEGAADADVEGRHRHVLQNPVHVGLGERRALSDFGHDLLIVVGVAQLLRQPAPQLAPAAAEFAFDGDDSAHVNSTLSVVFVYRSIIDAT